MDCRLDVAVRQNFSNLDNFSQLLSCQCHAGDWLLIYILQNFYTDQASGFSCAVDCRLYVAVRQNFSNRDMYNSSKLLFYQFHAIDWLLIYIILLQNFYTDQASGSVPWTADLMLQCGKFQQPGHVQLVQTSILSISCYWLTTDWYTYCRISILTKLKWLCAVDCRLYVAGQQNFSNWDMNNSSQLRFYQFHASDWLLIYILQNFYTD